MRRLCSQLARSPTSAGLGPLRAPNAAGHLYTCSSNHGGTDRAGRGGTDGYLT
eukprot:CAMPEP_0197932198 /NCGR_PEP_ID=MMETSP1439-20131203/108227_1 /TAXON_ID=66791 /ORGANISM="Gonyaulax spinifera, Strain CCMP409" /LENGTH=52 /DNA_ID=CAMNT_0043554971 /DNA_START=20 /DNA_END=174 /DNA_ORIENTATION=+